MENKEELDGGKGVKEVEAEEKKEEEVEVR